MFQATFHLLQASPVPAGPINRLSRTTEAPCGGDLGLTVHAPKLLFDIIIVTAVHDLSCPPACRTERHYR